MSTAFAFRRTTIRRAPSTSAARACRPLISGRRRTDPARFAAAVGRGWPKRTSMLRRTAVIYLGVSLGAGAAGLAQNAQPADAGAAQPANRPGAMTGPQTPVTTLKADAQLVVVDVVVT